MTPQQQIGNERSSVVNKRATRQERSHMHAVTVTGRAGDLGVYPSNHTPGGPYPLHNSGGIGGLDLRQHESGVPAEGGAFLHSSNGGRGAPSSMGLMGSASTANAATVTSGSRRAAVAAAAQENKAYAPEMAVARQCEREGCNVQPSYGTAWKKPRFCARHKLPGMMDVRNRRCEQVGCTRQPSYGQEGQRRQFCFTHKREGDVDVKSTRCKSTGCPKHAMYGRPGEMPQYCSAHKAEDMVDVKKRRRCNADGCDRRASYAMEGEKAAFCSAHKQPGHVNVNNRRCEYHGCSRRPVFSKQGEKPRFCVAHKLDGMSDSRLNTDGRSRARAPARQTAAASAARGGGQGNFGGAAGHHLGYGVHPGHPGHAVGGGRPGTRSNDPAMFRGGIGHPATSVPHGGGRGTSSRQAAAQATVSAAAAVIAAMEDEARLDYRGGGGHHHGSNSAVGYSYHPGEANRLSGGGGRNGAVHINGSSAGAHGGYRETESSDVLYDYGTSGGGMPPRSKSDPVGGWTSALFAADRDAGSNGTWTNTGTRGSGHSQSPPSSAEMAPSHGSGHGGIWNNQQQGLSSRTGSSGTSAAQAAQAATAVAVAALAEASPPGDNYHHHMSASVTPVGGSHYLDDRNRGMLSGDASLGGSNRGGGGSSGGGDFFSAFASSNPQFDSSPRDHEREHVDYHTGGAGGGDGGDLAWERRPRPPPLPAPLPPPSSWSRGGMAGGNGSDVHRLAGLVNAAPGAHRLPSLINTNNRRSPPLPSHGHGLPYENLGPHGRGGSDDDGRS